MQYYNFKRVVHEVIDGVRPQPVSQQDPSRSQQYKRTI